MIRLPRPLRPTARRATAVAALALAGAPAFGQSAQIPAPPQNHPILIEHASIWTGTGQTLDDGWILLEKGTIADLGSGQPPRVPDDAVRVDASGLHAYPGLVATTTQLGLTETGAVDVTHDYNELGDFTPEVRAAVAVNPDSDLIPVTRANGIMLALVFPTGGTITGRCSTLRLDGWTWEDMAIDPASGLVVDWPRLEPVSFGGWWGRGRSGGEDNAQERIDEIDRFFDAAETYVKAKEAEPAKPTDLRYEAMREVLAGEKPIYVQANSAGQIQSAVAWGERRGYDLVIVGGHEADETADLLNTHDIPVIVVGLHRLPRERDADYDQAYTLPKKLHDAGVTFCIASGEETPHERNLNHHAGTAAAYGLPVEEALKAVTVRPAEIIGIGDRYGTLEKGKSATLILTTGNPLEITSDTVHAFIDGRRIDLGSRHKRLHEKYRQKYRQLGRID